jgi:hypothetical protein
MSSANSGRRFLTNSSGRSVIKLTRQTTARILPMANNTDSGDRDLRMTNQHIGYVTLLVRDYDEAKAWYCDTLGFNLIEDTPLTDGKRWVLVAPQGPPGRVYCWREPQPQKRRTELEPRQEAESFSSCIQMISGKTSMRCGKKEFASGKTLVRRATASLPYLKIFMAISGIFSN